MADKKTRGLFSRVLLSLLLFAPTAALTLIFPGVKIVSGCAARQPCDRQPFFVKRIRRRSLAHAGHLFFRM
jgi:hypothetical protein